MTCNHIKYFILLLMLAPATIAFAQRDTTLSQEVEVVKAYKPTISDANKINEMPKIDEEKPQKPTFDYSIYSQPIFNTFSVNTLKAATFADRPDTDNGFGLVRVGVGNYYKPYGEIFLNNQNTKNTIFGIHGRHLSSHGKLTLEGGDRVKAPFSENEAEMFIKHLYKNSILSIDLDFNRNGFNYYGYPEDLIPSILKQDGQEITYQGTKQAFTKAGLNINLENSTPSSQDVTVGFNFKYDYFATKTDQKEHFSELLLDIKKPLETGTGMLKAGVTFVQTDQVINRTTQELGESQQIWFTAKPSYFLGKDAANIQLGANVWMVFDKEADAKLKITPNIRANLSPVKEIINIFAGVDGNYINNHYSKIAYENPFVAPMHDAMNTFERLHFYGGFDGKIATKTNFKISADYSKIKDQPIYYLFGYVFPNPSQSANTPDPSIVENDFSIFYDDMDLLKFNLEIFHASSEKMNLLLTGNYYVYKLDTEEKAWNMPDWDAKMSISYNVTEQLSIATDLYLTGQREALILDINYYDPRSIIFNELNELSTATRKSYILDTVFDLNFNATYKITQQFSVFGQLNNFGFQKYQRWLGYPVQSFNILGGLSYSF